VSFSKVLLRVFQAAEIALPIFVLRAVMAEVMSDARLFEPVELLQNCCER
jgi:hypothetical protein